MAKVIEGDIQDGRGRSAISYPWDEWFDGRHWEIVRGEDFDSSVENFRGNALAAARRRSMRVKTHLVNGNTIRIQAVPKE